MEEFSDRFKKKMNRLFREQVGSNQIPHPEVDNNYEKIRSKIIRIYLLAILRIKKRCSRR
ncbi:MAG: hypothetical protein E7521_08495 [Ruminococcaceae bacterium]|nr:hypothetical protein [Oscillospiraceae bacterium]